MRTAARDDAYEIESLLDQLSGTAALRPPASPAEARAAAFVNGRLRRAGMGVSTYELRAVTRPGGAYALIGGLGLLAAALAAPLPQPSLLAGLLLLLALLYDALGAPLLAVGPRRASQNIVGNRAIAGAGGLAPRTPRWRVLLVAPLDSPQRRRGLSLLAGPTRGAALLRLLGPVLLAAGALLRWLAPAQPLGWAALALAAALLLLTLVADLLPLTPDPADGGLAALATMVAAVARLGTLERVELWAIAVGAAGSDAGGVGSLATRFPFGRHDTLAIALEGLAGEQLLYATREGGTRPRRADPTLLRLAAAADAADPLIDAEPRSLAVPWSLAGPLRRLGYGVLTVGAGGAPGTTQAAPRTADPQLVERATRLVVGMVRRLEQEP